MLATYAIDASTGALTAVGRYRTGNGSKRSRLSASTDLPPRWSGVADPAGAAARAARYCFSLTSTPPVARASFAPLVVATSFISTPFWFFSVTALAPPPTVAPAPTPT